MVNSRCANLPPEEACFDFVASLDRSVITGELFRVSVYHRQLSDERQMLVRSVAGLMERYGERYWSELEKESAYPTELVDEFAGMGFFSAPIPKEYGGSGLGIIDTSLILEEVNANGGNAQPFHGQYYLSWLFSKFASASLKERYLPELATGALRMQTMALTEPEAGSETTKIKTFARREGNKFIINGEKVFSSRVEQSDIMILVARTTDYEKVEKKTDGISIFLVDMKDVQGIEVRRIKTMFNSQTYQLYINNLEVRAENMIGEEGKGFPMLFHALDPERILLASESIGDSRWFIQKAVEYAATRVVFGRQIGRNQGVQFPIANVYAKMRAAESVRWEAGTLYDSGEAGMQKVGEMANIAKYLAAECAWEAANVTMDTYGGYGLAVDTGIERKFREARLYKVAPISHNLVLAYLAHNVLGLPKSY